MRFSYSNIQCFSQCPYKWKLRYLDKLRTIPATNADNALYLGLALHRGIEKGSVEEGVEEYKSHYNIITDAHVNWMSQLEYQIPKVLEILPQGGEHELELRTDNFVGFVDYVCDNTLYDFKFSNNVKNYLDSPQLSIYKYYLEKVRPDVKIEHLKFVFVPKVMIRQKKTETIEQFRNRLMEKLKETAVEIVELEYDEDSVFEFQDACSMLSNPNLNIDYPKHQTRLCNWCDYQKYCESNGEVDWMLM